MRGQLPLLLALAVLLFSACSEKYDLDKADFLEVTIIGVDSLLINSFSITATIANHEVDPIDDYGLIWTRSDTLPTLFFNDGKKSRGKLELADAHTFSEILELDPATSYRIIAYATIGEKTVYSPPISNMTGTAKVITEDLNYTKGNTIHLTGQVIDLKGGLKAVARGFCWSSTNPEPGLQDTFINLGTAISDGSFETNIGGLINDTVYYFRAYAILSRGLALDTIWGETKSFDGDLKNAWTRKASFPGGPRVKTVSFVIDDQAYVGGGKDTSGVYQNNFFKYDPLTDSWTPFGYDFPGVIFDGTTAFSINGVGYMGIPTALYSIIPGEGGWTPVDLMVDPNCEFSPGMFLETFSFVIGDKAYFISKNEYYFTNFDSFGIWLYEFEPQTDSLRCICSAFYTEVGYAREAYIFSIGSQVFYGKGIYDSPITIPKNNPNTFELDLFSCTVSPVPNNGINALMRLGASGVSNNGKGYFGLGQDNNEQLISDFWQFDPNTDQWQLMTPFPGIPRMGPVSFSCRGRIYIGLGSSSIDYSPYTGALNDLYEFDPE